MSDKPETARECAERLVGVRWTPKSGWPTEVEFLTGTLVDSITSALEERERERDRYLTHLRNLLARIHKDGGHYTDAVGIDRACQDADVCIIADRNERDTLKEQLAEAVELMRDLELYKTDDHNARRVFLARVKGSTQSDPIKDLCALLKENNMGFVFWVCDNPEHRMVTWEHKKEGSVATCDVCGKKSSLIQTGPSALREVPPVPAICQNCGGNIDQEECEDCGFIVKGSEGKEGAS